MTPITYYKNAEDPSTRIWWEDDDGSLVDFSAVTSWSVKIGQVGETALLTKTSGVTGAAGAGAEPSGTPNLVIVWAAGELNLAAGAYVMQVVATTTGRDRTMTAPFRILNTVN